MADEIENIGDKLIKVLQDTHITNKKAEELNNQVIELKKQNLDLTRKLEEASIKANTFEKDLERLNKQKVNLEDDLQKMNETSHQVHFERNKAKHFEETIIMMEKEKQLIEASNRQLQGELESYIKKNLEFRQLFEKMMKLEKSVVQMYESLKAFSNTIASEVKKAAEINEELKQEINGTSQDYEIVKKENESLKLRLAKIEFDRMNIEEQALVESLSDPSPKKDEELFRVKSELDYLKGRHDDYRKEIDTLRNSLDETVSTLSWYQKAYQELKAKESGVMTEEKGDGDNEMKEA